MMYIYVPCCRSALFEVFAAGIDKVAVVHSEDLEHRSKNKQHLPYLLPKLSNIPAHKLQRGYHYFIRLIMVSVSLLKWLDQKA